jgi:beta-phosphoglucomutase
MNGGWGRRPPREGRTKKGPRACPWGSRKIVRRRFITGSRRFLYFLKKHGFVLTLVTGTARHEVERILSKELLGLFSVIITGNDVKKGKPHPEPYLIALKKLQMKPKDVVVFENAPFGIISAKRAHLRCLALETYLPKTYLKRADFVFSSYQELCRRVHFTVSRND